MKNFIEYPYGQMFGSCKYIGEAGWLNSSNGTRSRLAKFKCKCGNEFIARLGHLKSGNTKSCGCLNIETAIRTNTLHGLSYHPLKQVWSVMKDRCYNHKNKRYPRYGGRGITVCDEWRNDLKAYYDYVMSLPNAMCDNLSLDRKNNDEGYKPGNMRWASNHIQATNTGIRKDNKSGYIGVWYCKKSKKWVSEIRVNKVKVYFGSHDTPELAIIPRNEFLMKNNLSEYKIQ